MHVKEIHRCMFVRGYSLYSFRTSSFVNCMSVLKVFENFYMYVYMSLALSVYNHTMYP